VPFILVVGVCSNFGKRGIASYALDKLIIELNGAFFSTISFFLVFVFFTTYLDSLISITLEA